MSCFLVSEENMTFAVRAVHQLYMLGSCGKGAKLGIEKVLPTQVEGNF